MIEENNKLQKIERDENGLIKGLNYIFDVNGKVNWRKMIKLEHLVPMKGIGETDVSKLQDKDLLILLQGIKELADIRGYKSVTYRVLSSTPEYCCVACNIKWISNYEHEGREIEFESIGDASLNSTESFAKLYLGPIAENRAFVRCVRNFLRIAIIGKDEIGVSSAPKDNPSGSNKQVKLLENLMQAKGVRWEHIVDKLKKENTWKDEYESINDLPKDILFSLIERLKKVEPVK